MGVCLEIRSSPETRFYFEKCAKVEFIELWRKKMEIIIGEMKFNATFEHPVSAVLVRHPRFPENPLCAAREDFPRKSAWGLFLLGSLVPDYGGL